MGGLWFLLGILYALVGSFFSRTSQLPTEWRWLYSYFWPIAIIVALMETNEELREERERQREAA